MRLLIFINFIVFCSLTNAQELKKVTKTYKGFGEIYYVLKENKSIKHGQYLKYHESMDLYNKAIDSYGKYDQNKKIGVWLYCDVNHPMNPLITLGSYAQNKRDGEWIFFYSPILKDTSVLSLLGYNNRLTKVILPSKGKEEFQISLDTAGIKVASIGNYQNGKKVGIWNYYSRDGKLVSKIDFSSNNIVYNNLTANYDQLNGINRFKELVHQSATETTKESFFTQNSYVAFEIITTGDSICVNRIKTFGSEPFAKTIEDYIKTMSLDWISYDPRLEQNKIKIYVDYKVEGSIGKAKIDSVIPISQMPIFK